MKLIFLDIDGVMNHRNYMVRSRLHHLQEFCPLAVRNLREIVKRTRAGIVISSTWRKFKDIDQVMACYDLDQYVEGKTPVIDDVIRGIEIQQFLEEFSYPVESFVILDDGDDMGILLPNLVHCEDYSGLTDELRESNRNVKSRGAIIDDDNERVIQINAEGRQERGSEIPYFRR